MTKEEKLKRREIYFAKGPWCVSPNASMLDLIVSKPGNVLMPRKFLDIADRVYNFQIRSDDVFVVTFPKCGTTWMQELVWQLLHDFDPQLAAQQPLTVRSPFLEMESLTDEKDTKLDDKTINALDTAENMKSPRVIKTHLPIDMLPPDLLDKARVVFVARNPMDCCVSFYHHEKQIPQQGFAGSFQQYAELFRNGKNPMGNYFYHLLSGWSRRNHPNLKFVWFEDMKSDIGKIIDEMSLFLKSPLSSESKKSGLISHLHIDNFRKNSSVNMKTSYENGTFIRKGSVGGWKQHFDDEIVRDWKVWIEERTKETGIQFNLD